MADTRNDDREFTDEELRAAIKGVGAAARAEAFAKGQRVVFVRDSALIALYPDGTEKILKQPVQGPATRSAMCR